MPYIILVVGGPTLGWHPACQIEQVRKADPNYGWKLPEVRQTALTLFRGTVGNKLLERAAGNNHADKH